jgi:hypothetical protein
LEGQQYAANFGSLSTRHRPGAALTNDRLPAPRTYEQQEIRPISAAHAIAADRKTQSGTAAEGLAVRPTPQPSA